LRFCKLKRLKLVASKTTRSIDECRLNVNPVVLGKGIPLFAEFKDTLKLQLVHAKPYDSGVVGLHYWKG